MDVDLAFELRIQAVHHALQISGRTPVPVDLAATLDGGVVAAGLVPQTVFALVELRGVARVLEGRDVPGRGAAAGQKRQEEESQ
jgi:hypothetical protein